MRYGVRLGIDVGRVRVGVAASDPIGIFAHATDTLSYVEPTGGIDCTPDIARIATEVRTRGAIEVVVGLPLSLNGSAGAAAELSRGYAGRVAREVAPVPVRLVDERLTTVSAHQVLRQSGVKGRKQRRVVDQVAAVLILQTALDAERATGRPAGDLLLPGPPDPPTREKGAR